MATSEDLSPEVGSRRFFGQLVSVLVGGAHSGGHVALIEVTAARGDALPMHVHHLEDEVLYVLEGELTVHSPSEELPISAGAAVALGRGVEHSYVVESEVARFSSFFAPAGFEDLVLEVGEAAPSTGDDAAGASVERLVSAAARYGMDITGQPPRRREIQE